MTKIMKVSYPSIADMAFTQSTITHKQLGIDTIELIARYEVFKKMADTLGLTIEPMPKRYKLHEKIKKEVAKDTKSRRLVDEFTPIVEMIRLPKVGSKDKSLYISIVRNVPTLFDVAKHHKKAKGSFCRVVFAGLHQPTKKISSDAMKIISKFLKRKTFKLSSVDIAIDTTDHRSITEGRQEEFKANLMPYSKSGINLEKGSYYVNQVKHQSISRINYYDKYLKQLEQQKKTKIGKELKAWKRLEITLTFDVTKRENKGFIQHIESLNFYNTLHDIDEVASKANIKRYATDYLIYQINSLLDNRFMNNHESKEQFNSVESLERFNSSDFRRYILAI